MLRTVRPHGGCSLHSSVHRSPVHPGGDAAQRNGDSTLQVFNVCCERRIPLVTQWRAGEKDRRPQGAESGKKEILGCSGEEDRTRNCGAGGTALAQAGGARAVPPAWGRAARCTRVSPGGLRSDRPLLFGVSPGRPPRCEDLCASRPGPVRPLIHGGTLRESPGLCASVSLL